MGISEIVKTAIEELNAQLENNRLQYKKSLPLIGRDSMISSIDFVALISIIGDLIEDEYDLDIEIVSDRAFSQQHSPFQTIGTLETFIEELIEEAQR